ncbi:MAG: ATP-binding protein, partial [Thiohalorhabdaceae bacterium]
VIEVADDGAGLSADKLRKKAVERGIVDANEADQMADREAQQLIFSPGFSSAEQVSDISGRGVGMDVVRSNVEELKGSIELDSEMGQGTTVRIRLPLTLSIQQTLIVQIGPEHFAIPLETVKETLDFEPDKVTTVRGQRVYQREGEILPILQMTELFGMSRVHDADASYLVVMEMGMQ